MPSPVISSFTMVVPYYCGLLFWHSVPRQRSVTFGNWTMLNNLLQQARIKLESKLALSDDESTQSLPRLQNLESDAKLVSRWISYGLLVMWVKVRRIIRTCLMAKVWKSAGQLKLKQSLLVQNKKLSKRWQPWSRSSGKSCYAVIEGRLSVKTSV